MSSAVATEISSRARDTRQPDRPTVSVIIPSYNSAATLGDAIDSALRQTHAVAEVIVVDDGSSDHTAAVAASKGERVHCARQPNAGPSRARNRGAELARGEWLAFLDADDMWLRRKCRAQLALARRSDSAAVLCGLYWPTPSGETIVSHRGSMDREYLVAELLKRNVLAGGASTLLVRRDAFLAVGGFDEALRAAEDRELLLRLANRFRMAYLATPLARRRRGPVEFGADPARMFAGGQRILERHARLVADRPGGWRILREARARLWQRAGLQHLQRGDTPAAMHAFGRAMREWPLLADPWRAGINWVLGRLTRTRHHLSSAFPTIECGPSVP